MLYVRMSNGRAVEAQSEMYPDDVANAIADQDEGKAPLFENRNDWKTMARAEEIAAQLTENTGVLYIATDAGSGTSPRYDVIEAPKVGDKVSQYFNGDAYPEGEIVKISASLRRVETSTGKVFNRKRQTGQWLCGGFGMIAGHVSLRNPSF